jgi:ATP adenylyltransferase
MEHIVTETLWAPWRMDYILDKKPSVGCVFCLPPDHNGPLKERLVLYSDPFVSVLMNRFPYNNCHLLVAPRRHVATLSLSTREERSALIDLVAKVSDILTDFCHPDGFNMGINQGIVAGAGISDHLHMHITPRFNGDTNYMTVISETRVIPEHIQRTYEKLVELFY